MTHHRRVAKVLKRAALQAHGGAHQKCSRNVEAQRSGRCAKSSPARKNYLKNNAKPAGTSLSRDGPASPEGYLRIGSAARSARSATAGLAASGSSRSSTTGLTARRTTGTLATALGGVMMLVRRAMMVMMSGGLGAFGSRCRSATSRSSLGRRRGRRGRSSSGSCILRENRHGQSAGKHGCSHHRKDPFHFRNLLVGLGGS